MKYEVCVGQEFPCSIAEDSTNPSVVVNVHHAHAPSGESKRLPTVITAIGLTLVFMVTVPATVYGMATGDFSALKGIASSTRGLLEVSMKMLK